ncbi:inner membrane transporter RhtA [Kribbella antiqua]|uniref:Inner membrane transporter RhtA n=1 Tax=Kribbella antiqua TaxID=2512217 RepID=A0A4R2J1G1_9ACTN|nr:EamA family transporter [Kribbella antiqua]TCO50548.1 inner membrane transporter RhtA [Kribbella antiqua]
MTTTSSECRVVDFGSGNRLPEAEIHDSAKRSGRLLGVLMMLGSGLSTQVGASVGALGFPVLGPVGVVAVRQWVAAVVLVAVGRPNLRAINARQWRLVLGLAVVFAVMNLSLYTAIDRVGLGLAVTLEFLGPLAVALLGSRRLIDLVCALAVAPAVVLLTRPEATTDYAGIGLGLLAALCWACYILLNRRIGRELSGVQGVGAAAAVSGLAYVPIGVLMLLHHRPTPVAILYAVAAGVLSSAVPFLVDMLVLRRVPAQFFGVFMSINPVLAAVVGLVVLDQRLGPWEWFAIGVIVCVNAVALSAGRRRTSRAGSSRRVRPSSRRALPGLDPAVRKGVGDDGERWTSRAEE